MVGITHSDFLKCSLISSSNDMEFVGMRASKYEW